MPGFFKSYYAGSWSADGTMNIEDGEECEICEAGTAAGSEGSLSCDECEKGTFLLTPQSLPCSCLLYRIHQKNTCNNSEMVYNLYVSQVSTALARVCGSVQPAPRVRSTTRLGRFSAFPALQVNKTSYFVTKLFSFCRF